MHFWKNVNLSGKTGKSLFNFSTLKRVVKGHCTCRPLRESIDTKPKKVKCKCIEELL